MLKLLAQLEASPDATFSERWLTKEAPEDFEQLLRLGLLKSVPQGNPPALVDRGGTLFMVRQEGERYLGIEADEIDPLIVEIPEADVRRWAPDVERLVARIHERTLLSGTIERVSDRLWYLGSSEDGAQLLLGLYKTGDQLEAEVTAIKARFPAEASHYVVACPTLVPPPLVRARLEKSGLVIVSMRHDDPLRIPLPKPGAVRDSLQEFTQDNAAEHERRTAFLGDEMIDLSPRWAKLVRILVSVQKSGQADLPWNVIQVRLQVGPDPFYASRMQDILKTSARNARLVIRTGRGRWAAAPGVRISP